MLGEDVVRKVVRDEIYGGEMLPILGRQSPYASYKFILQIEHEKRE